MARSRWFDPWVDLFVAELAKYELTLDRQLIADLFERRAAAVGAMMGIRPETARRHITEEDVEAMAQDLAFSMAAEQPGADVGALPRDRSLDRETLTRALGGLAMAGRIYQSAGDDHACSECLTMLVALSVFFNDSPTRDVPVPAAWCQRASRRVEISADLLEQHSPMPAIADTGDSTSRLAIQLRADADAIRQTLPTR